MTRRLRSRWSWGWVVLTSGLVFLAASAQTPAVPSWVSDPQVYAAAKKEGAVVHYCTLPQAYCEDIGKRFEKHTGIKADITRTPSGAQYSRLMQEHQAGPEGHRRVRDRAGGRRLVEMKAKGMLEPYLPRDAVKIDAKYRDQRPAVQRVLRQRAVHRL